MMRRKRRRSAWENNRVERNVPPTMETAIKNMPNFIGKENLPTHLKYLEPPYWEAACEIAETRQRYLNAWKDKRRTPLAHLIEGAAPSMLGGSFGKYEAWMDKVVVRYIPFNAVVEMIEGLPPWEADRLRGRPLGMSAGWLIEALRMYINLPVDASRATVVVDKANKVAPSPARKIP